jgi:hypothetical protein
VGLTRQLDTSEVGLSYSRSFVPPYSFGGTSHNEELSGHARVPVARRVFVNTAFALRQNEPLEVGNLKLRSLWFHGSVGYLLTDWVRIEGFSTATRQDIDRPGGRVNRYTFGIQITATTTARIR